MAIDVYDASIVPLDRTLNNLTHILDVAIKHTAEHKIDDAVLFAYRLYPDMLPLASQVLIAADISKACAARLSGSEVPKYEDNEKTLAELIARVDKTRGYINGIDRQLFDGAEQREVTYRTGGRELRASGLRYLYDFALPNVYFHVTTTYAILRHCGVRLGKRDYIGSLDN